MKNSMNYREIISISLVFFIEIFCTLQFAFKININITNGKVFHIEYIESLRMRPCPEVTNSIYNSLIQFYGNDFDTFLKQKLADFTVNADDITKKSLNYVYTCLVNKRQTGNFCCPIDFPYHLSLRKFINYEVHNHLWDKYIMIDKHPEVFAAHHGLRYSNPLIKEYVKNKDIMDIGGWTGDSSVALAEYTNKHIYIYEIGPSRIKTIKYFLEQNNITGKVIPVNLGMGNQFEIGMKISLPNETAVDITTVDNEVKKRNLHPGFIKADIEGCELKMLQGANETIKKFRPIISVSAYHNFDGLFRIHDYINSFPNYKIEFRAYSPLAVHMGELIIFAYPAEIGNFDSFENMDFLEIFI